MISKMVSNKVIFGSTVAIAIIFVSLIGFMSINTLNNNTINTTVSDGGIGRTTINKTITITSVTTLPTQIITLTATLINNSIHIFTTTLPPNVVTETTTIIQQVTTTTTIQATTNNYILGNNKTIYSNITTTKTLTTNITLTKTKNWSISGAKIEQPEIVESITFTFLNFDRFLQIGSYIAFSPDYVTINKAVKQENNINITHALNSGNVIIDSIAYQYITFDYRDMTGKLRYAIIAVHFYPETLRTYYIFYESSSVDVLTEMRGYLNTFKIGV